MSTMDAVRGPKTPRKQVSLISPAEAAGVVPGRSPVQDSADTAAHLHHSSPHVTQQQTWLPVPLKQVPHLDFVCKDIL